MKIIASNSLTLSNVNDGTITHTAWSYSADGTDRFTTTYPNLNLLDGSKKYTKDNPKIVSSSATDGWVWVEDVHVKNLKAGTYTLSAKADVSFVSHSSHDNRRGKVGLWLISTQTGEWINLNTVPQTIEVHKDGYYFIRVNIYSNGTDIETHKFWDFKLEPDSIATPYIQSASELTTADWPKYRGEYSDMSSKQSTNPSDYTWSLIRGNDGKPGLDGHDGRAGKDGNGIKTTVITYAISTSGTVTPVNGWTSQVPTLVKEKYLWTKAVWTYTDNTSETGYSVSYIAKDGNNGHDGFPGKDGVGIKATAITYAKHTNGTTAPTTGYTTAVPSVPAGQFLWTKTVWTYTDNSTETGYSVAMMGVKGDKGDQGIKGSDGTSGIIVSSVAPASPKTGQLWQDTSTTPQLVKKWTGSSWVIWKMYVENMVVHTISSMSSDLGEMIGGTLKLMDNIDVNGTLKKFGIYQSKLGLLSSGAALATTSTLSNSQMGVASLNKGELRFIVTNYTENLKGVQDAGMSDQNNAFIKFDSYDNGKDVMTIGSSGDIVFKGITSQDTPWIAMLNGTYYKNMFSRIYISYSIKATSNANILLGVLPVGLRPFRGLHLTANAWATTISNDRHIEVRTTGEVTLYNPVNGASYDGEVSFTL